MITQASKAVTKTAVFSLNSIAFYHSTPKIVIFNKQYFKSSTPLPATAERLQVGSRLAIPEKPTIDLIPSSVVFMYTLFFTFQTGFVTVNSFLGEKRCAIHSRSKLTLRNYTQMP